jgi:Ser-tRNA(Ala) deacylase AlaX
MVDASQARQTIVALDVLLVRDDSTMRYFRYYQYRYRQEFEALVQAVEGQSVALDRTAFYPGGGGQPCDLGALAGDGRVCPVLQVRKAGDTVWHAVEGEPPAVGDSLLGRLDWERRYGLMRLHTALHLLCGVIWRDYGALVTGGNMEPGRARMDLGHHRSCGLRQAQRTKGIHGRHQLAPRGRRPAGGFCNCP